MPLPGPLSRVFRLLGRLERAVFGTPIHAVGPRRDTTVEISPETRAALNVHLLAAVGRDTHLLRLSDAAARHDPLGLAFAQADQAERELLAGELRSGRPVTVERVLSTAMRDPHDALNAAMIEAVFRQTDAELRGPAPASIPVSDRPAPSADGAGPNGPRRLL